MDAYYKEGIEQSTLYEDEQEGFDYTKGIYSLRNFKLNGKKNELIIQQFKDGTFITDYDTIQINLIGLPFKIETIELDNEIISLKEAGLNGNNSLEISKNFTELHIMGK